MEKYLTFECPQCGHTVLEEIATACVVSADVLSVTKLPGAGGPVAVAEYGGDRTVEYGDHFRYQCGECGVVLTRGDRPVRNMVEVAEWLESEEKEIKRES